MLKDQEMLQRIREKVLIRMMREHLKDETEKLKREIERVSSKLSEHGS